MALRFQFLERLFRSESSPPPRQPQPAAPTQSKIASADFSFLTMEEIVRSGGALLGTRLHIVTLRAIKEAIGEEWGRYVRKISLIVDSIVRRHLGPKGTCGRQDDDTLIFSFGRLPEAEGRKIAADIAKDLMRVLIGDRFGSAGVAVAEVAVAEVLDANGQLDLAALERAIDSARRLEGSAPAAAAAEDTAAPEAAPAGPGGPDGPGGPPAEGPQWMRLRWPPEGATRQQRAIEIPAIDPADALGDGLAIVYRPVLNVRVGVVDTCLCLPARRTAKGLATGRVLPAEARPAALANLDFALLFEALSRLVENIEARRRLTMIVPILWATAQPPFQATLVSLLKAFSDGARSRYLFLELTAIPKTVDEARLRETIRTLRGLCRDVFLRFDAGGAEPALLKAAGAAGLGFNLAALRGKPAPAVASAIAGFARLGAPQALYLLSANRREDLAAAVENGYAAVAGDAVGPPAAAPGDVLRD